MTGTGGTVRRSGEIFAAGGSWLLNPTVPTGSM